LFELRPTEVRCNGYAWSRRITDEHRLVYLVDDDGLVILQARFHSK
jgi:Txe/YoeB family toxin of toxin-antitoxin system